MLDGAHLTDRSVVVLAVTANGTKVQGCGMAPPEIKTVVCPASRPGGPQPALQGRTAGGRHRRDIRRSVAMVREVSAP